MTRIIVRDNKMKIRLTQDEVEMITDKAKEKSAKFTRIAPVNKSPYGFNHVHSHVVGLGAEYASHILFQEIEKMLCTNLFIEPSYADERREGECDLYVGNLRVEVKGIKYKSWLRYGPCISTRQLSKIQKTADVVVWALYNERCHEFTFIGFNDVSEISSIRPVLTGTEHKIENYPVRDILKPLETMKFKVAV